MAEENWGAEETAAVTGPAVAVAELPEVKLFGKWSTDDVQVSDISLTVSCVTKCSKYHSQQLMQIVPCAL